MNACGITGDIPLIKGPPIDYELDTNLATAKEFAKIVNTHFRTVENWMSRGILSQDRRVRVVLQHLFTPKGRLTSMTAYKHFIALLSTPSDLFWMPNLPYIRTGDRVFWQLSLSDIKWIHRHLPDNDRLKSAANDIIVQCGD